MKKFRKLDNCGTLIVVQEKICVADENLSKTPKNSILRHWRSVCEHTLTHLRIILPVKVSEGYLEKY